MNPQIVEGSRLLDLRCAGRVSTTTATTLSNRLIVFDETLDGIDLPNVSLCGDFLIAPGDVWAGVAVSVTAADMGIVSQLFKSADRSYVNILGPEETSLLKRYQQYPGYGRIEVIWSPAETLELLVLLTNGVLWYELADRSESDRRVVVLGLEDLHSRLAEAGRPLIVPSCLL